MSLYAYDAAYAPDLAAVKRAGGVAVNGYLTGVYADTTTQPAAARAAGLGYVPTYEQGPSELVNASRATGQSVGRRILAAFTAKRIPLDGTVAAYPSVDVNAPATSCNESWRGMRDVLAGKVSLRAYAEGAVIDALVAAGLVDGKCWLAAPSSWPGFNVNDPNICMVQLVGTDVAGTDRNHLVTDPHALGAWWPAGSIYGSDMPLTETDVDKIWTYRMLLDDGKTTWQANHVLKRAYTQAEAARVDAVELAKSLADLSARVDTIQAVIGEVPDGIGTRVASIQAAVAQLNAAIAALTPAEAVQIDAATIVSGVVDGLASKKWTVTV